MEKRKQAIGWSSSSNSMTVSKQLVVDLTKEDIEVNAYGTPRKSSERVSTAEASRQTIKMSGTDQYKSGVKAQLETSPCLVKNQYIKRLQDSLYLRPTSSFGSLKTYNILMSPLV
jgi:hypothetical protein